MDIMADGLAFAEGPVALPNGDVLLVETMGGRLTRVASDGRKTVVAEPGGGPNGAAIGPDGRCYLCNNGGMGPSIVPGLSVPGEAPAQTPPGWIEAVDLVTGAVQVLYRHTDATPFWGPNDLVFDAAGGFWFTDFGRDCGRIRRRGGVYYAHPDGAFIEAQIAPMDGANGIGLSPDGGTLYVAETYTSHLWRFHLSAPGVVDRTFAHGPLPGSIVGRGGPGQFLDSLAVDSEGYICCASPGHGHILVFPPEGGAPEAIQMPDFLTTNIAFGGPGLRTAFITLGSSGRLGRLPWPRPGLELNFSGA
jgi:gluconolactonase